MAIFGAMDISGTGIRLGQVWLDAVAHNVANVNTVTRTDEEPFRAQLVLAEEASSWPGTPGEGVRVRAIPRLEGTAPIAHDPLHPLADEDGNIQLAHVDLPGQMADLILASRHYQVNVSVLRQSQQAYESAMRLGR
jgi:flagellar basal-body rod protein FlgC